MKLLTLMMLSILTISANAQDIISAKALGRLEMETIDLDLDSLKYVKKIKDWDDDDISIQIHRYKLNKGVVSVFPVSNDFHEQYVVKKDGVACKVQHIFEAINNKLELETSTYAEGSFVNSEAKKILQEQGVDVSKYDDLDEIDDDESLYNNDEDAYDLLQEKVWKAKSQVYKKYDSKCAELGLAKLKGKGVKVNIVSFEKDGQKLNIHNGELILKDNSNSSDGNSNNQATTIE